MKKIVAILMTLCLLCASCAALADMEPPVFENMPLAVMEDENTTISKDVFDGEWTLNVAFLSRVYLTEQELAEKFSYNFMPITIDNGKVSQDIQDENGEFHTGELELTFEAGQLWGTDGQGYEFVIELLEDNNIVVSVFVPGEGEEVQCLSLFMQHPEKAD